VKRSRPVLVWGLLSDPPTHAVTQALREARADVLFIDQENYTDTEIDLSVDQTVSGTLRTYDRTTGLQHVQSFFLRPQNCYATPDDPKEPAQAAARVHARSVEDMLLCYAEVAPCLVVNRPSDMSSNNSKPNQAALIREAGFATPATLMTTDPDAVLDFFEEHGAVIYKSISGIRSIVRRLDRKLHAERLVNVENCPTQFQEYIPGIDVRVHVIGETLFACTVESPADDYRYAAQQGISVAIKPCQLDRELADRCLALAKHLRMALAGIDLRRTSGGQWYCFEVNPSPGFTYYQAATGDRMDMAVAELLMQGR